MRRASEFKTNLQHVINKSGVEISEYTAFYYRVARLQGDRVSKYTAHRQREARISQKAFSTPHIRYMFAGHVLGTRWMGAIYALNYGIFEFFSDSEVQSHIVDARPAH